MATKIQYPTSPESPSVLLKLALNNGLKATSTLLVTSVLGTWLVAMISYLVLNHLDLPTLAAVVNLVAIFLVMFFSLAGMAQLNALYEDKPIKDLQAFSKLSSKLIPLFLTLFVYIAVLFLITWFSGNVLQYFFKPGTAGLGIVRVILGFAYLYFLVATFLILPLQVMTKRTIGTLISELMHVCLKHWLRCFLCLFVWLIVIDVLAGNLALSLVPTLAKIAYSMIVVKTVVAVIVVPVLISYTTLLAHDVDLRAR